MRADYVARMPWLLAAVVGFFVGVTMEVFAAVVLGLGDGIGCGVGRFARRLGRAADPYRGKGAADGAR